MTSRPTTFESANQSRRPRSVARARRRVWEDDIRLPAAAFGLHWLLVTLFAALGTRYAFQLPVVKAVGYQLPSLHGWQHLLIQPLRNWDGFWYSLIANEGYDYHPAATAFWPLFPWTMRLTAELLGTNVETAGWLLANTAFFAALVVFFRLARLDWGDGVARRAVWLIALFPTAYYFSAVYSESFFLLFSLVAFYCAKTGKWWQAGLAAALAGLTRNIGVLLIVPLAIIFIRQHSVHPRHWPSYCLALALPVLGPAIYFFYLGVAFGDPLLTLDVQRGWARTQAMPWETFAMAFDQLRLDWLEALLLSPTWTTLTSREVRFSFAEFESLDITVTLLAIPLLIYCLRRMPIEYGSYTAIVFILPMFSPSTIHPLMSYSRFVLVLFPLFIALALLTRRRIAFFGTLATSTALLALLTIQFSTWFWVA